MRRLLSGLVLLAGIASITAARQAPDAPAARRFVWETAAPGSQGMSKEKLDALKEELASRKTKALLIIRNASLNLIAVRNGEALAPPPADAKDVLEEFHDPRARTFFEPLIDAITH